MATLAPEAIELIKAFEGKRLKGYRDPIGIPTIGYGHTEMAGGIINYVDGIRTSTVRVGAAITEAEADRLKAADLAKFAAELDPILPDNLTPLEYGAAMSLAFNIGPGNFRKSSLLRFLKAGNKAKAADQFLAWNKAGGKVLPGLTRRRQAERALFLGDIDKAESITGAKLRQNPANAPPAVKPPPAPPSPQTPTAQPRKGLFSWLKGLVRNG